jgi:RimJ/RimL family protein N-acetyltransferase
MQNFKIAKQSDGTILNLTIRASDIHTNNGNVLGGTFVVTNANNYELISKFKLEQFNGCNGICISKSVMIADNYRGKGLGTHFLNLRESVALDFGYSAMMCSVVLGNLAQQKIMDKNGWQVIAEFDNKRTSNRVRIYYKKL